MEIIGFSNWNYKILETYRGVTQRSLHMLKNVSLNQAEDTFSTANINFDKVIEFLCNGAVESHVQKIAGIKV